jgi:hypothetical protein
MRILREFPHAIREIEHVWIPMSDGCRLSGRIWLPVDAETHPVPAILEYLPYRKDDLTAHADSARHPYYAGHGYAAVRVDIRGSGDSDGLLLDEYTKQEQDDALEVIAWLAAQPWCSGRVGMIGYSWGGFNGLQVAARRPPALGAVVTAYSTDDRYADDCHYMGGCVLGSDMLKWASWMLAYGALPPDPSIVGAGWREQWLKRLEGAPPFAEAWLSHQTRDAFWRHGSVAEDYDAIRCPVLAIGGWADPYTNAVPRLLENLSVPVRGIIGPWAHVLPERGVPGPAIGFLQECVRWFDRWLKDEANGAEDAPLLRVWLQDSAEPATFRAEAPGRWLAIDTWPPPTAPWEWPLGDEPPRAILGDQTVGETAGAWCPNGVADELPADQQDDDDRSLTFETEPLEDAVAILGRPEARLTLSVDRPLALVAVRLCDVAEDGSSTLVSWAQLNLTHRNGDELPEALEPGAEYRVTIPLNVCGHTFSAGRRIRLSVSPTYWPHAWPSPESVTLTLDVSHSTLALPVLAAPEIIPLAEPAFGEPEIAEPLDPCFAEPAKRTRVHGRTPAGTLVTSDVERHRAQVGPTSTTYIFDVTDTFSVAPADPLSARVRCTRVIELDRPGWSVKVLTESEMASDAVSFGVTNTVRAFEGSEQLFERTWNRRIPRNGV